MDDKFVVSEEIEFKNISESWNFAQTYFENTTLLVVRFRDGRKKEWKLDCIKTLKIIKTAIFNGLKPNEFQFLYNNLNLSMISELEMKCSTLTLKEFTIIKQLNLKSIYLFSEVENGKSNPEIIEFILDSFVNIPKIRVTFDIFYEGNFFENFIVAWIIKNGYRESFIFTFRLQHFPWFLTFASDPLIISGFDCYQLEM
uniref:Uncharacterized protein n=1 Tax=Panagrolaimus sp. PS1159 TaxID=55785 RepID=A0AC35G9Q7_9BILA